MQKTTKLNLNKPDPVDFVDIEVLNANMDTIDTHLGDLAGGVKFTQAEKDKLANATEYTHPATHPASILTETAGKKVMTAAERIKLAGIAESANNYTHPSTHPASIITQDSARRFVSDTEKAYWNGIPNIKTPEDIPVSANLNSYQTGGYWRCVTNATAVTLSNMPDKKEAFSLMVIPGNIVRQIWMHHSTELTYMRSCYQNIWSPWKEVAFRENLTKTDVGLGNLTNDKQATAVELQAHIKAQMPHEGQRTNGTRYRWGFKSDGGSLIYMEEDI